MEKNETNIPKGTYQIRPNHYGGADNPLEARKIIDHYGLGFNLGNVVKYVLRCGKKDSRIKELRKAMTYLEFEIEKELADMDSASAVPQESTENVWSFDTLGVRVAKVNSLITSIGHEAAIALYEKEIALLDKESPKNHYKINQCFEAMAAIKKKFHEFKPKFEEQSNAYNLNIGPDLEDTHLTHPPFPPTPESIASVSFWNFYKIFEEIGCPIDNVPATGFLQLLWNIYSNKSSNQMNTNVQMRVIRDGMYSCRFHMQEFEYRLGYRFIVFDGNLYVMIGTTKETRFFFITRFGEELNIGDVCEVTKEFMDSFPDEFTVSISEHGFFGRNIFIDEESVHDRDKEIENTGERV